MHKDLVGSDRMGAQLIQGLGGYGGPSAADLDLRGEFLKLQEQLEEMRAGVASVPFDASTEEPEWMGQPFICGVHKQGFENRYRFDQHIKTHAKEAVAA
jgi:hypothetical protein